MKRVERWRRLPVGRSAAYVPVSTELLVAGGAGFRKAIRRFAHDALEVGGRPVGRLTYRLDPFERYGILDAPPATWTTHVVMAIAG